MPRVDPDNDSIRRYIVRHYRYDPDRHERRHVVVAAFDREREYMACLKETARELRRLKDRGEVTDPIEHVSGGVHEPGYRRKQQNARMVERALRHGVSPASLQDLEMPSNVGILRSAEPPRPVSWWRRTFLRRGPNGDSSASTMTSSTGRKEGNEV